MNYSVTFLRIEASTMPQPMTTVSARGVPLLLDDIDTDRIIPARFLRCVTFDGLGEHAFEDDRQQDPRHPFDDPRFQGGRILVAGRNFGCGSSREHAPWALADFGIQAVVAPSFADIFRGNALKNGIVPVQLAPEAHAALVRELSAHPSAEVTVDVAAQLLAVGVHAWPFPLAPFARHCLLEGIDQLGYLLAADAEIARFESRHPAPVATHA
jgi:3-isopropylmalate/(R)-2-methylmalate dehydratase small subunit